MGNCKNMSKQSCSYPINLWAALGNCKRQYNIQQEGARSHCSLMWLLINGRFLLHIQLSH